MFGGIALVFALGTRQHLANLIGAHYVRKHYAPGDYVRVGAFEGPDRRDHRRLRVPRDRAGDVSVPAHHFSHEPFVKLRKPA